MSDQATVPAQEVDEGYVVAADATTGIRATGDNGSFGLITFAEKPEAESLGDRARERPNGERQCP